MVLHVQSLSQLSVEQPSIVTVGMFDGVHRGHQWLVRQLVEAAQKNQYLSVVLTFFPHPDVVIRGITGRYYLTEPNERAELLGELGVDIVVTFPFNEQVRQMRAQTFVDQLVEHTKMVEFWATADFALGYKREGNIAFLQEQGTIKGFRVHTIELVADEQGDILRSALIRDVLNAGDIRRVSYLLGRPYRVKGTVVHGEKRGRKIGFPTANVSVWEGKLLPANGVYACWAFLGEERFMAVTNVGQRPTFDGEDITVEAHLLDFDRDIYGEELALDFVERLRGEMKFDGIQSLINQIQQDVMLGRSILSES
ncbi:MAG: bifunctional riboflavin kinase/FMN adenylyltransferase [Phototrophicales bacterium]|nr:MAG: bifunctional riboflavin kinase/FMN adenylyltransferase [Phototrophicales bacterium]